MVVVGSKLCVGEDVVVMRVMKDLFGDDFLKQFAAALEEADWAISFGEAVVRFGRFGDDDNKSVRPRVMTEGD